MVVFVIWRYCVGPTASSQDAIGWSHFGHCRAIILAATPPAAAASPAEERPEPLPGAGGYDRPIPAPGATPIGSISQPGKFTVELKAVDRLSKKTSTTSFPITVLEQKP